MREVSGKRSAATILAIVSLLGTGFDLYGQEILSTTGIALGGLEPWDTPSPATECDQGIRARVTDILRPHVVRLNAAEATVQSVLASKGWRAAADEALTRQRPICEDILAVIGIVKRHNAEVSDWRVGEFRRQYMLTAEFLTSGRLDAASTEDAGDGQGEGTAHGHIDRGATRWPHLSVVWVPFEVAFEIHSEQRELLGQLGLSSSPWEDDPALALYALLALLRQADMDSQGLVTLADDVRLFFEQTGARYVETYGLGCRRSELIAVAQAFETYLGRELVVPLGDCGHTQEITLELGSYRYLAVPPTRGATCMAQAKAPVPKIFLDRAVWTAQIPDAATFCGDKVALYAVLATELQERVQAAPGESAAQQAAALYAPYLWALAHGVPCLSPFRLDGAGKGNVRFTEGWVSAGPGSPADLLQLEENLNTVLAAKGVAPRADLFLLQADFSQNIDDSWQWAPRHAGFRGYLNRRRETTRANGVR